MAWREISYTYATTHVFQKHLLWLAANADIYFAMRATEDDDWTYFAGTAAHALDDGLLLTEYAAEADAQTNYLTTDKDDNGKVIAMIPGTIEARFVKMFVSSGSGVQIYEWWPSTYLTAHELVSGEILITDEMSEAPHLKIVVSDQERVFLGNLGSDEYGLRCRDAAGNIIFESSSSAQNLAGWTFTEQYLYKLVSGTPAVSPNAGVVLDVGVTDTWRSNVTIYDATPMKRAAMGWLYEDDGTDHWGIGSQDASANILFEISDQLIQIAGWNFDYRYFYNLGSGTPASSPQEGVVLDIGDGVDDFPCITVYDAAGLQRAAMGWLYDDGSEHWGIGGLDALGNLLFEISDQGALISGWTIGTASLTGGNATLASAGTLTLGTSNDVVIVSAADATYRLWAGHATAGSAPFRVTKAGALTATSATITGTVTATAGDIGGWTIISGYIYELASGTPTVSPSTGIVLESGASAKVVVWDQTPLRRAQIGYLYDDGTPAWGMGGYDGSGNILFEISNVAVRIAGWTIATASLSGGNATLSSSGVLTLGTSNDVVIVSAADATYRLWAGHATAGSAPFRVTKAGALTATSATITGVITANTGYIGGASGWVIAAGKMTSTGIGLATSAGDATYAFWAGDNTPGSAEFRVTHAGALTATSATITGVITANTGYIGGASGWVIAAGKMTSTGIGLATSAGDATYAFWAGDNTPASAEFSVTHAGALKATSGTIGGWTLGATSLSSGTFTLNSATPAITVTGAAGLVIASSGGIKITGNDSTPGFLQLYGTSYPSKLGANADGSVQGWRPDTDNTCSLHIGVATNVFTFLNTLRWSYIYVDAYSLVQLRAYVSATQQSFLMLDQGNDMISLKTHSELNVYSEFSAEAGQDWSDDHYAIIKVSPYSGIETGTSTSVGLNTLTDSSKSWTTNAFAGFYLQDAGGNTYTIASNTATVITISGGFTPTAGVYWVRNPSFVQIKVDGETNKIILSTNAILDSAGEPGVIDIQYADRIRLQTSKTPASTTAAGTTGDICWDTSHIYVCIGTDTWRAATLTTF